MERKLLTVAEFAKLGPISESGLRWHIFQAANNGLNDFKAVVRIRRRVYIDPAAFSRWIDSMNQVGAA